MRNALRAFLLLAVGSADAAVADEPTVESRAFVELVAPRDSYFVHEVIHLRVRFGLDADFLRANVLQLFQRSLDVPVQVQAPWVRNLPGTILLDDDAGAPGDGPRRVTLALEEGVASATPIADVVRDGRTYAVWEIERSYLPERPGELSIPAPTLRFAYATRFADDFVQGHVPLDRRDASVRGAPLVLTIRALPDEGRPPEFTGAVGRFTATADVDRREVVAGDSLKLALRIEGAGDLAHFDAPRLDGIAGFHVYGTIEGTDRTRRVVTYDIAPLDADVKEAPSIAFAYFDPGPRAEYRIVRTSPIPLKVRGHGRKPIVPRNETERPTSPTVVVVAALVVAAFAALALFLRRRARNQKDSDSEDARIREAGEAFRAAVDRPDADVAEHFAAFVAVCMRCSTPAVITPDLAARLTEAGVPTDLAVRVASLLEGLVATRYGRGEPEQGMVVAARALVGELEAAFRSARTAR